MSKPTKKTVQTLLLALDIAEREYREAYISHHEDFPAYIPNDRADRLAYADRKDRISQLKKRVDFAQVDFVSASLALLRLGG
jgi:hypothetical protein